MAVDATRSAAQRALREGAGLLDRSERGKLAFTGPDAAAFLDGQLTNAIAELAPGTGCAAALLTGKGKMLGELRVLHAGDELWVDVERGALQEVFDVLRRALVGWRAELHKRTLQQALLSLAGPRARAVAGAEDLHDEHANRRAQVGGAGVRLAATDAGVDVICAAEDAERVRAALLQAGAEPVQEADAEILRVEAGRPRYGAELDDTVIPQEAGLNERLVSFTKGCYPGQETVARLHWKGKPNRHLRGLRLDGPVAPGDALRLGEREVGRVGTVADSPVFGPIALAIVRREASPGDVLQAGGGGATAQVVALPFGQEAG